MKAAIVQTIGQAPIFSDFSEPKASEGENLINVTAAAISQIVKSRASGRHYSLSASVPFVVGIDGVGRLNNGKRVYFVLPTAPFGSMAESCVAPSTQCIDIPDELDDLTAAAIANPGMSSWAAFSERAKLKSGETVLINGATGISGQLAVQIAKHMGAKKVIATGRNIDTLARLKDLGADVTIALTQDEAILDTVFKEQFSQGVDVVIDYLWGNSARQILIAAAKAGANAVPMRFIQVGSISGEEILLSSAILRSSSIEMMGSGIGSIPLNQLIHVTQQLLQATVAGGFKIAISAHPLSQIEQVWGRSDGATRVVLTLGNNHG